MWDKIKMENHQEHSVKLSPGFRTCSHVPVTKTLNQVLAALFENIIGSEILQQDEETSYVRPSASSSLGFVVLPLHISVFQV